jgi:hypothetical protein
MLFWPGHYFADVLYTDTNGRLTWANVNDTVVIFIGDDAAMSRRLRQEYIQKRYVTVAVASFTS